MNGSEARVEPVLVPMRLAPDEKDRLYGRAKALGISANELMRRMIREDAPAPESPALAAPVSSAPAIPSQVSTWDKEVCLTPPLSARRFETYFHWAWEEEANAALGAGYHVLMLSPHGMGKSVWAGNVAAADQRPFYMTSALARPETLEGQFLPKAGTGSVELQPCDGIISSAATLGGLLVCEEFLMMPPDSQSRLLIALAPNGGLLDVPYRGGQVKVHDRFQVIAVANPPRGEYLGAERLNAALLSRWYVMELEAPTEADLLNYTAALGLKFPKNKPIVSLAVASYEKFAAGEWDNIVSPREIALLTRGLRAGLDERRAFFGTVANKFAQGKAPEQQQQVRAAVWDLYANLLRAAP